MIGGTMQIEVGKYYRTRDGRKARIYAVDGSGNAAIHGAVHHDGKWSTACWLSDGYYYDAKVPQSLDLISEWIDKPEVDWSAMPRWAEWVAMDKDGEWTLFSAKPSMDIGCWWSDGDVTYLAEIPPSYAPKWDGDWRDSLVRRTEEG
jgi:hypothetical protein